MSDAERAKLDALAKALADRPNLSMEISGFVDAEADRQGLVDKEFEKQLLAGKKGKKIKKEEPDAGDETEAITPRSLKSC